MKRKVNDSMTRGTGERDVAVVRVFAHGAMGRRIDPSWWTH